MTFALPPILARLRGLSELALPGARDDDDPFAKIAATIAESLGYGTVAINLVRPAWDDFEVVAVHGDEAARRALLGATTTAASWATLLVEDFYARGAYLVPRGAYDWDAASHVSYVPSRDRADGDGAWDPEDALFVPVRDSAGRLIGVLSVDEPVSGRRPTDEELDGLVAVAAHAARAVESAQMSADAARHRRALELLLDVSSKLTRSRSTGEILQSVCDAVREALGFELVVVELADREADRYVPVAAAGGDLDRDGLTLPVPISYFDALFDPTIQIEGCTLLTRDDARARVGAEPSTFCSTNNGRSAIAWDRHWLVVPLHDRDANVTGFIWADDPTDFLVPKRDVLQALRLFANQAAMALDAADQLSTLERRSAELEALHGTAIALIEQSESVDDLLERLAARAGELVGTDNAFMYLVDADRNELEAKVSLGMFERYRGARLAFGEGLSGRVWAEERAVVVDDYSSWQGRDPFYDEAPFRATIGVPLRTGNRVVGVLGVGFEEPGRRITDGEQALLARFAQLASLVLENARLLDRLQQEKAYSQRVVQSANALVVGVDTDGGIEVFNAEAERVTGFRAEDVLGRSATALLGTDPLSDESERPITTTSGEERLISWRHRTLDVDGQPRGTISFGLDVTDRRTLEEELRQSQKMEAVGRLAGGIAHDFNNLLTAISGYGELALTKLDGVPAREYVEEMQRASERAAQLTRQLLAFSRRQVLQFEVVDVNAVVADLERMLARLLGAGIDLDVRLDASLAPTKADPGQLQQVVLNLALNARDAMPDGGTLTIATANEGPNVVLTVSDTGEGMDEETLARVFEPFFTTKPAGEGTGLGLATVYGIVKQTGGEVSVRSARGEGTIFEVSLPRSSDSVADRIDAEVPEAEEAEATLLLVEDEDVVRRLAAEMLRGAGYRVLEASNGAEAMAIAQDEELVDVLLSDVVMPGFSGPQVAQELRRDRPELRVLFMSGYTADAIASDGDLPANTAFLSKPFTRAALLGALADLRREALVTAR